IISGSRDRLGAVCPKRRPGSAAGLQPRLHLVAQDLAGGAAREILEADEVHRLRALVAGKLLAAQRLDLLLGQAVVVARDEGDGDLAPTLVLAAHNDRVADAGLRKQHALDL